MQNNDINGNEQNLADKITKLFNNLTEISDNINAISSYNEHS